MAEIIENEKLPWPNRLADSSLRFLKLGIIICVLSIPLSFLGVLGVIGSFVLLSGASVIFLGFLCSIISFIGLLFYRFKVPGLGKVVLVMIISYPVFAVGYAIISPALVRAKSIAKKTDCLSNMSTLAISISFYTENHSAVLSKDNWCDIIKSQIEKEKYFECPADKNGLCSYAMNENMPAEAKDFPEDLVLLFESAPGWNQTGGPEDVVTNRHDKPGANIAFADGHVEFVKAEDIPNLCWMVED